MIECNFAARAKFHSLVWKRANLVPRTLSLWKICLFLFRNSFWYSKAALCDPGEDWLSFKRSNSSCIFFRFKCGFEFEWLWKFYCRRRYNIFILIIETKSRLNISFWKWASTIRWATTMELFKYFLKSN